MLSASSIVGSVLCQLPGFRKFIILLNIQCNLEMIAFPCNHQLWQLLVQCGFEFLISADLFGFPYLAIQLSQILKATASISLIFV